MLRSRSISILRRKRPFFCKRERSSMKRRSRAAGRGIRRPRENSRSWKRTKIISPRFMAKLWMPAAKRSSRTRTAPCPCRPARASCRRRCGISCGSTARPVFTKDICRAIPHPTAASVCRRRRRPCFSISRRWAHPSMSTARLRTRLRPRQRRKPRPPRHALPSPRPRPHPRRGSGSRFLARRARLRRHRFNSSIPREARYSFSICASRN